MRPKMRRTRPRASASARPEHLDRVAELGYDIAMLKTRAVKIGEARNNLSSLLRYVKKGGRVRIFDRNTAVAEIVPVRPMDEEPPTDDASYLKWAFDRGLLEPPAEPGGFPLDLLNARLPKSKASVLEALLDERRTGR